MNRAVTAAMAAANDVLNQHWDRRRLTIEKFGRHRDGYLHARVMVDDERYAYFHRKYGSWLAPGNEGRLKEPEGLLGAALGRSLKYLLSEASEPWDARERKERERQQEEAKKHGKRTSPATQDPGGDHEAAGPAGLQQPGGESGTPGPVQPDAAAGVGAD